MMKFLFIIQFRMIRSMNLFRYWLMIDTRPGSTVKIINFEAMPMMEFIWIAANTTIAINQKIWQWFFSIQIVWRLLRIVMIRERIRMTSSRCRWWNRFDWDQWFLILIRSTIAMFLNPVRTEIFIHYFRSIQSRSIEKNLNFFHQKKKNAMNKSNWN